jgi:hypothetical protein
VLSVVHRANLTYELHRNGALVAEGSGDLPANVEREQNFLGRSLYDGAAPFPGQMGEIPIYGRASTDGELLTIEEYLRSQWSCCSQ